MLYKNIKILQTAKYYILQGQYNNKHEAVVHNKGLSLLKLCLTFCNYKKIMFQIMFFSFLNI